MLKLFLLQYSTISYLLYTLQKNIIFWRDFVKYKFLYFAHFSSKKAKEEKVF